MNEGKMEYMTTFVRMSKAIALWPLWINDGLFSLGYHATLIAVPTFIGLIFLSLSMKIATSFQDMDGIATVIDFATLYASGVFRYTYCTWRGAAIKRLIDKMDNNFTYESFNPTGVKLTMKRAQINGKRLAFLYYYGSLVFVFQMIVVPIFIKITNPDVQTPLIFEGWYPFNISQEPIHSMVFVIQAIGWLLLGYLYLTTDCFWYMIIFLTIGQLQVIAHSYTSLIPPGPDDDGKKPLPPYTKEALVKCVKQHQLVRSFTQDIENILSPIILVDFIHATFSITFLLLDITIALSNSDWVKILHLSQYLIVSIVHMFCFDWLGNELVLQEEKVAVAMYDFPWYREPRLTAAALTLTTSAARKPCRLTGGKFYYLTLEFFVMAMRSIFSYFMVLFQLRNDA